MGFTPDLPRKVGQHSTGVDSLKLARVRSFTAFKGDLRIAIAARVSGFHEISLRPPISRFALAHLHQSSLLSLRLLKPPRRVDC
jgi:hypothetical protein